MAKTTEELKKEYEQKYSSFNYDAEEDELFALARKNIERRRRSGVSDTLARYAASTGMGGSSEAMAAAQQTAALYDRELAEALFDAEDKAYKRWSEEKSALGKQISEEEQREYERWLLEYERELEAERNAPKVGKNGMTEEAFLEKKSVYDDQISSAKASGDKGKVSEIYEMKRLLIGYYYGFLKEDVSNLSSSMSDATANDLIANLTETRLYDGSSVYYIDMESYAALAGYFAKNPYVDPTTNKTFSGEDALRILKIVPKG